MLSFTPSQNQFNSPNQQQILKHSIQDSKVYLSRTSNNLLKAIGNDVILEGLQINNISYTNPSTINITLNPGLLIQDTTLIHIKELIELSINIQPYNHLNGYLIIYTDYQFLTSGNTENHLKFKISYITHDGMHLEPFVSHKWDPNRNRILLHRLSFTKLPLEAQESTGNFSIFGQVYSLFGESNFTNSSLRFTNHASPNDTFGYATSLLAGHIKVGDGLNIDGDGILSVPQSSTSVKGSVQLASLEEAMALESDSLALTPRALRELILELKDIQIVTVDPGITLGTALILS